MNNVISIAQTLWALLPQDVKKALKVELIKTLISTIKSFFSWLRNKIKTFFDEKREATNTSMVPC